MQDPWLIFEEAGPSTSEIDDVAPCEQICVDNFIRAEGLLSGPVQCFQDTKWLPRRRGQGFASPKWLDKASVMMSSDQAAPARLAPKMSSDQVNFSQP